MAETKIVKSFFYFLIIIGFFLGIGKALAHPMPNSVLQLKIKEAYVLGELKSPYIEYQNALSKKFIDLNTLPTYYLKHIKASSNTNQWQTKIDTIYIQNDSIPNFGTYQEIIVKFKLIPVSLTDIRYFTLNFDVITHQVINHQIMVVLCEDWINGVLNDNKTPLLLGTIKYALETDKISPLTIHLEKGSVWKGFKSFCIMGINHIIHGLDHIFFIVLLLLIAPVRNEGKKWSLFQGNTYTFKRFLSISLFFTLGHSFSLFLGTFNLIPFEIGYIEVFITITIILTAIHTIKPIFPSKETMVGLIFGTIHGLAFSESISSLDLTFKPKLISMLGFNLGIEIAQIGIILIVFPLLLFSKYKIYHTFRFWFALTTILLSMFWFYNRIQFLF
ncbi:HupE/UreJ family protein [Mariniflexile jejuense]|uniref:HupE/UreJ family protein n=1 Tax=Mariniflexile jejuense TaxID=1173582 RepID=A0ABW3JEL7_9FLAO